MTTRPPRVRRLKNTAPDANELDATQPDAAVAPDGVDVDVADMAADGASATAAANPSAAVPTAAPRVAQDAATDAPIRAPATRPLVPLDDDQWLLAGMARPAPLTPPGASHATHTDLARAADDEAEDDADDESLATAQRPSLPSAEGGSRPRWKTLAGAVNAAPRQRPDDSAPAVGEPPDDEFDDLYDELPEQDEAPTQLSPTANAAIPGASPAAPISQEGMGDGIANELDEWSIADQPTVQLTPQMLPALAEQARLAKQRQPREKPRPSFLDTDERQSWPPRANAAPNAQPLPVTPPNVNAPQPRGAVGNPAPAAPNLPRPPVRDGLGARPATPLGSVDPQRPPLAAGEPRLASPGGRPMPATPPEGVSKAELPSPRMERFQELRRQRVAHDQGERDPEDAPQFGQVMRQWWNDLRPGLASGLAYQHDARASGTYPIPAYAPAPTVSRLGDAFGRLARSARELTERAQSAAGPRMKQLHDQVEQAAQGIVERFEGGAAQQQAPFLGPGRIAIFFRQGVTVGQAQRLMMNSAARPMRLIPRKHGFLARVRPGTEATTCDMLRRHPYVRDVAYLEYDEYGQPMDDE